MSGRLLVCLALFVLASGLPVLEDETASAVLSWARAWVKSSAPAAVPDYLELCSKAAAKAAELTALHCSEACPVACPAFPTASLREALDAALGSSLPPLCIEVASKAAESIWQKLWTSSGDRFALVCAFGGGLLFWPLLDIVCLVRAGWQKFVTAIAVVLASPSPRPVRGGPQHFQLNQ